MDSTQDRLTMTGISKHYGGVRAIRHADLTVRHGEVMALVGENGAGKSTLIKILSGAEFADTGTIMLDGEELRVRSTTDAIHAGIRTVYQEPRLFKDLTVAENLFVGREVTKGPMVDWSKQAPLATELLRTVGLDPSVATRTAGSLTIADQQLVSIAKALFGDAKVLILDEPSAILAESEIAILFQVIRNLTKNGVSIIYISHRLDELPRVADRITVMRDGTTIATRDMAGLTIREIAELMVGSGHLGAETGDRIVPGDVVAALEDASTRTLLRDVSLEVHTREIVGVYGLVGSGVHEIGDVLFGMQHLSSGAAKIRTDSGRMSRVHSTASARRHGIRLLPSNRATFGIFSFQSVGFNITIGSLSKLSRVPGLVSPSRARAIANEGIARFAIKTPSERQPVSAMSGGNAQKVILSRQLVTPPKLLILSEPTQGVDVGAKQEIYDFIVQLATDGAAVLVLTTDISEVQRISDRILIMRQGRLVEEFPAGTSQADILTAAAGETGEDDD